MRYALCVMRKNVAANNRFNNNCFLLGAPFLAKAKKADRGE